MIGTNAETVARKSTYSNLSSMAHAFQLAEAVATTERPILSRNGMNIATSTVPSAKTSFHSLTQVPLGEAHNLLLGVGSEEQGFYQVPLIQLNTGIDVLLSGRVNEKGEAVKNEKPVPYSQYITSRYGLNMNPAQRVFAVALIPTTEELGNQLLVAGINKTGYSQGVYSLATNGFLLERGVVSASGQVAPIMFPDAEGKERYLKATEVLSGTDLAALEAENVFPGLMVVAGKFQTAQPLYDSLLGGSSYKGEESLSRSMSLGMSKGAGRVGVETGDASTVKYGKTTGRVTSIDGLLALHLLAVGPKTTPEEVTEALKAYQR